MKSLLLTLMFAVVLVPFAAAQTKSAGKSMKASGTIVSATDMNLVISSASKKESTFVLNADTKKTGAMMAGAKVVVTYKMDGKDMVATAVKAAAGGATTASTGGATKSATKKKAGY